MERVKELYQVYERYIFQYLYGLTFDYHVAEELTQETFYQILKAIPGFRGDCHVSTWIYKIARNVYCGWRRKKTFTTVSIDAGTYDFSNGESPEDILERKEKHKLIKQAFQKLPEKYREVLWLRDWQELSYAEIAAVTNHSIPWVKVNIHRARLAFKKYFLERSALNE